MLCKRRHRGAQHGAIDTNQAQAAEALGNRFRVRSHIAGKCHHRVTGPLPDAYNSGSSIAFEYGAVFGISKLARGVLRRLPV